MINNINNNRIKVVIFRCDKCGKEDTLVAYHHAFGWYCKDCLTKIRDGVDTVIKAIDMRAQQINEEAGIDPHSPDDGNNNNQ